MLYSWETHGLENLYFITTTASTASETQRMLIPGQVKSSPQIII